MHLFERCGKSSILLEANVEEDMWPFKPTQDVLTQSLCLEHKCPDCGSEEFNHGPCGGEAENIRCAECGAKFWFSPPFTPVRIDNVDSVYDLENTFKLSEVFS